MALMVALLLASGWGQQTAYAAHRDRVVFTIRAPRITESSSLAVSTVYPGLVYTTNDSGDNGTVYAVDRTTGAVVGRTTLAGADPLDVEAVCAAADGTLVVADIGDNDADHTTADLYRIPQPGRGDRAVVPDRVDLTYVGGPRDAESVLFDVQTGRAFVVSKLLGGAKIYATPPRVFEREQARLQPVAAAPTLATDATFLPDGDHVVVRTYVDATVYAYPSWKQIVTFGLPQQEQGESITAPRSGDVVWVGSEGARSRVLAVPLPSLGDTEPRGPSGEQTSTGPGSGPASGSTDDEAGSSSASSSSAGVAQTVFVVSAAALIMVLLGLVVVAFRRSR